MYISGPAITGEFRATIVWRTWWLAPKPPIAPGDCETTADGFLSQIL